MMNHKDTKAQRVPSLRFPEFDGEWQEKIVEEIYPKVRNGFVGVATPHYRDKGVLYLQGKNIKFGTINSKELVYISKDFHEKCIKSQLCLNDIVMVQSGHVGECALITQNYVGSNCHALLVLTPRANVSSSFYVYYFYSEYGRKLLYKITTGNTIKHILSSEIKLLSVPVPVNEEQQKIADFLTAADKRIEQLEEKKRLLTEYKKGVMQHIFSQQIRFKDDNGNPYPDWEGCDLIEISENGLSNGVFNDPLKVGRGYKLINVKDMYVGDIIDIDTLSLLDLNERVFVRNKVEYGDIFFTRSSLVKSGIAYTNVNLSDNDRLTYDGHLIRMRPKKNIVNPKFLAYLFKTDFIRKQLIKRGKTATMTTIGQDDVAEISVFFPELKEQQKIANFLTSIDNKIEQVVLQLGQAKTFKKGLLQQMFV